MCSLDYKFIHSNTVKSPKIRAGFTRVSYKPDIYRSLTFGDLCVCTFPFREVDFIGTIQTAFFLE